MGGGFTNHTFVTSGQNAQYAEDFIAEISGTQRFIFDYLAEEVFQRLATEEQDFLLYTSILEKMDGESCDYILKRKNSLSILENLEASNLGLSNSTGQHKWFFTHQLLREFLLGKFRRESQELLFQKESLVATFYENKKEWEQAFSHYIQAKAFKDAARVLEMFAQNFIAHGRVEALNHYLSDLDDDTLNEHPELLL